MGVFARLRGFSILASLALGLIVPALQAGAADTLVLGKPLPTLFSLTRYTAQPRAGVAEMASVVEPICDIFANGYDETGSYECPGCFDKTLDFSETDIDCGGTFCKACADGKQCAVNSDCSSAVCNTTIAQPTCSPATCGNNTLDPGESDTDCGGGTCPGCANGKHCSGNADCASSVCSISSICVASTCLDGFKDGSETDTDCGGSCATKCAVGKGCLADADCLTGACDNVSGKCVASACFDERKDGSETAVDCGGGTCPKCTNGLTCLADSDCFSNACNANSPFTCIADQCQDHRKDGAETDIDCGGGTCAACGLGNGCSVDTDCASNACDPTLGAGGLCVSNQCSDNRQDGNETDIDCGGTDSCARCQIGQKCVKSSDCAIGHTCSITTPHVCQ